MDLRKRINVNKTSTDKYSFEATIEVTGSLDEWLSTMGDEWLSGELTATTTVAVDEIKRLIKAASDGDA